MPDLSNLKAAATSFGKDYLTELALEFYRDDIVTKIANFFRPYSANDILTHIQEANPINPPETLFGWLKDYRAQLQKYSISDMAERLLSWIGEARPDIASILIASGDEGAMWLVSEAKLIRDTALSIQAPAKDESELAKVKTERKQYTRATCEKCGKLWLVTKEEAEQITRCPFCGEIQGVMRDQPTADKEA